MDSRRVLVEERLQEKIDEMKKMRNDFFEEAEARKVGRFSDSLSFLKPRRDFSVSILVEFPIAVFLPIIHSTENDAKEL